MGAEYMGLAYATPASNTLEPPLPALQFLPNKMPLAQPMLQEPPLVPLAYATLASNTLEPPLPALQFLPNKNQPLAQPTLQEPPLVPLAHATPASNSLETPLSALLSQLEMVALPN